MKRLISPEFAKFISNFLTDYLPLQRGLSKNTILSYRDTLKMFLQFLQEQRVEGKNAFGVSDYTRENVIRFLSWYRERGAGRAASNQRLTCLKTFASYVSLESIENYSGLQSIGDIKPKKSQAKEIQFFTPAQISNLINLPDISSKIGFKHRLLLCLLYDTGCRVQELCDIKVEDVCLNDPGTIRLHGKGGKIRTVVVSTNTVKLLRSFISKFKKSATGSENLITNKFNVPMNRDGVTYVVKKYAALARIQDPSFPTNVHCHMLRHSKAMHMLEAGINIVYIRDFLGHQDISTTMIYARTNNRVKEEVINKLSPSLVGEEEQWPDWNKDTELLDFLNNFK